MPPASNSDTPCTRHPAPLVTVGDEVQLLVASTLAFILHPTGHLPHRPLEMKLIKERRHDMDDRRLTTPSLIGGTHATIAARGKML